jgi:hypothetical protein
VNNWIEIMVELSGLTDAALMELALRHARAEREATVSLVACLAEIERRDILLERGYQHLFDFCVRALNLSEGAAGRRTRAAHAARKCAAVLSHLEDGSLNLFAVCRLEPFLAASDAQSILDRAVGMPRPKLEEHVAELLVRRSRTSMPVPEPEPQGELGLGTGGSRGGAMPSLESSAASVARPKPDLISVTAARRVRFSFDAEPRLKEKLEMVGTLLSNKLRSRRLEELIEALADLALRRLTSGSSRKARLPGNPRTVPWSVRREVWMRDEARCSYRAPDGTRCSATRRLQYDHVTPWALGGRSDDPANIRLLCRAHNLREGRKAFPEATARALAAGAARGDGSGEAASGAATS